MKSLKDISWQVEESVYRQDSAYSYSTIAKFEREGFNNLGTLFQKVESPSLLFGSCVDTLITGSQEEFDSLYFVADFPEISDKQRVVVESIFSITKGNTAWDKIDAGVFETALIVKEYQPNWRMETRVKVIREIGKEYYDLLTLAGDKKIISQRLYQDVLSCVEALRTSESTKFYFEPNNPFDDSIERLYQLKFRGEYEGIPLRGMMDLAVVDHKNKIIYPVDLKTSFKKEWDFPKSFIEWMYFIQAQLYSELLRQNIAGDDYFKDFKIANYRFIVISNGSRVPLVWEFKQTFSITDIKLGDRYFRNWRKIVRELDYYLKYNPKVPIGIHAVKPNSIEDYFNDDYTEGS